MYGTVCAKAVSQSMNNFAEIRPLGSVLQVEEPIELPVGMRATPAVNDARGRVRELAQLDDQRVLVLHVVEVGPHDVGRHAVVDRATTADLPECHAEPYVLGWPVRREVEILEGGQPLLARDLVLVLLGPQL